MSQSTAIAPFVVIIISQMADLFVDHDAPCPSNVRWFDLRREGSRLQCNHHLIITHPMFCVSRPLPKFGRVIRIQSAPDDFVPGTVPLRPKNAGDEVPLIFLYPLLSPLRISDCNFCLKSVPWVRFYFLWLI